MFLGPLCRPASRRRPVLAVPLARACLVLALAWLAAAGFVAPPVRVAAPTEGGRTVIRAAADQGILADGRAAQRLLEQRRLRPPTGLGSAVAAPAAFLTADDDRLVAPLARGGVVLAAERGAAGSPARPRPARGPPA
jgi:hypothetical protein